MAFYASYRNELTKLLARKKYFVFLFAGIALCLLWTGLIILWDYWLYDYGIRLFSFGNTPKAMLPFFLQVIVPFLTFMAVTDLITVEDADNTMKAMICRPVERWKLFSSKILAILTYAAIYLACVYIISTVLNQLFGVRQSVPDLIWDLISYALTLIPLAILASYSALIALIGRSASMTMFLLLLSYILLSFLPILYPILSEMLFTSYLSWYRLWIGAIPQAAKMVHMTLIILGSGVVFFTSGSLLFDRKEY